MENSWWKDDAHNNENLSSWTWFEARKQYRLQLKMVQNHYRHRCIWAEAKSFDSIVLGTEPKTIESTGNTKPPFTSINITQGGWTIQSLRMRKNSSGICSFKTYEYDRRHRICVINFILKIYNSLFEAEELKQCVSPLLSSKIEYRSHEYYIMKMIYSLLNKY